MDSVAPAPGRDAVGAAVVLGFGRHRLHRLQIAGETAVLPVVTRPSAPPPVEPLREGHQRPKDELHIADQQVEGHLLGAWHNILVAVWAGKPTPAVVQQLSQLSHRVAAEHPGGFSGIHLVLETASLPAAEVRHGLVKLIKEVEGRTACIAVVVDGGGFWASAMQGMVTGLRIAARRTADFRVATDIQSLAAWLPAVHQQRTGVAVDPTRLNAVLCNARALVSTPT